MMDSIEQLPPGWVESKRGGWHHPALAGYTGIIKPHRDGTTCGWAVYGAGRRQVAGWLNARSPAQAAAAAERAAVNAAADRLDDSGAGLSRAAAGIEQAAAELQSMLAPAPAGLAALAWCSVCRRDLARLRYCYGRLEGGALIAYCPRCYR